MEIQTHPRYPTMFLLGHRMVAGTAQAVGTAIVKGTFQDMDRPTALPKDRQVPIFLKDEPFNYIRNGDFESLEEDDSILAWAAVGGEVTGDTSGFVGKAAKLHSTSRQAYLTQTLTFERPVGGRTFVLSFYARTAHAPATTALTIDGFRLQAVGSGNSICQLSAPLTNVFQRFSSPAETWPEDETATEIAVILPGSGDSANNVYFDRVQVEESARVTRWDEETIFRYEHDLVPYKPHADIIILSQLTGPSAGQVSIDTDTGQHLEKTFAAEETFPIKTLLGWAPRVTGDRLDRAGTNLAAFNPRERALPEHFDNRFYNGYDRYLVGGPLDHLADGTRLTITSDLEFLLTELTSPFNVQLPDSRPTATLTVLNDEEQEEAQDLPLVLDTVIIEPELDCYLVVWRGTWPFDEEHKEKYITLTVTGGP